MRWRHPAWSLNNLPGATLTPEASYSSGKIKAGFIPGKFEISVDLGAECTAACPEKVFKKEFEVIEPNNVLYLKATKGMGATVVARHHHNRHSAGMVLLMYLQPTDVNFSNVMFREKNPVGAYCTNGGEYYTSGIPSCPPHTPNTEYWVLKDEVTKTYIHKPSLGTEVIGFGDESFLYLDCKDAAGRDDTKPGFIQWEINLYYKRESATDQDIFFKKIIQRGETLPGISPDPNNPFFRIKKGGAALSIELEDPNIYIDPINNPLAIPICPD
jgi:hypothetical protein